MAELAVDPVNQPARRLGAVFVCRSQSRGFTVELAKRRLCGDNPALRGAARTQRRPNRQRPGKASAQVRAAIHVQYLTRDEPCLLGEQERDHARHL